MLALAAFDSETVSLHKHRPYILAARNVHKSFVYACALLDLDVNFLFSSNKNAHLCSCNVTPKDVETALSTCKTPPCAVYVTSPDYLGNILDIKGISNICHRYGVPLLVDNAHGAYLAFMDKPMHPIALGADMCCDSAHKTLPALTGAGYLHISKSAPKSFVRNARSRLSMFASTSPSYLILQSLDLCNKYISEEIRPLISRTEKRIKQIRYSLEEKGFSLVGDELFKLTLDLSKTGITGSLAAEYLRLHYEIECEYSDNNYLVMMLSPQNSKTDLDKLLEALLTIPQKSTANPLEPGHNFCLKRACTIRQAIFSPHETVPVRNSVGRICASPTVSCPPAVPIAISGEVITEPTAKLFAFYGIDEIDVLK